MPCVYCGQAITGPSIYKINTAINSCVRYRYDYQARKRNKTVELIVSEQNLQPPPSHPEEERPPVQTQRISTRKDAVLIACAEKDLQQALRKIDGRWDRKRSYGLPGKTWS